MTYPLGGENAKQELALASERVNYLRDLLFKANSTLAGDSAAEHSAAVNIMLDNELAQIQANRSSFATDQLHMTTRALRQVQRMWHAHKADFAEQLGLLLQQNEIYQNELAAANSSFFHLTSAGTERAATAAAKKFKSTAEANTVPLKKIEKVHVGQQEGITAILVVGPDVTLISPGGSRTITLGDGVKDVNAADFTQFFKDNSDKIGDHTRILIDAHGNVGNGGKHYIYLSKSFPSTSTVLKAISSAVGKPVHVTICACFSGAAASDYAVLAEHSTLSTIGFPDSVTYGGLVDHLVRTALEPAIFGSEQTESYNPFARFAKDILCNPSLYCSFSPNIPGVGTFKFRFPKQFSREAILQHQRYEFARFVKYCVENKDKMKVEQAHMVDSMVSSLDQYDLFASPPKQWVENPPAWARDLQGNCIESLISLCMTLEYVSKVVEKKADHSKQLEAVAAGLRANGVVSANGIPALHKACYRGNLKEVEEALAANPKEVNKRDVRGHTPLMIVCISGNIKALKFLLAKGAVPNLNQVGPFIQMGALEVSLTKGHVEIVKLLVAEGADIESILLRGNVDHIRCLKAAGVDINAPFVNQQGNAVQICLENDDKLSIVALIEAGASLEPGILHKAVKWNAVNCLEPLLAQSAAEPNHQANVQAALDAAKTRKPNSPAVTQALEKCLSNLTPQGTALNAATITPASAIVIAREVK